MALSQDEQRVLAEIERRLTADDPGLATCLTAFRRPGPAAVLRSPRARIIGSLFTVLLVAMVSLMVYAMIPFRAHGARSPAAPTSADTSSQVAISTETSGQARVSQHASANAKAAAGNSSVAPAAGVSASTGQRAQSSDQAAGHSTSPAAGPLSR